jgi:hypothetical protein
MSERIQARFVRSGVLLLLLGLAGGLLQGMGLFRRPELAVGAHVTTMIAGALFVCLGGAWDRVRLEDARQRSVAWLLNTGALAAFAGGLIVSGLFGIELPAGVIRGLVLLVVALVGAGVVLLGSGAGAAEPGHEEGAVATRFLRLGALVLLLALVAGVVMAMGWTRVPRLAAAVYLTMLILGATFVALAGMWPRLPLSPGQQRATLSLMTFAAFGNFSAGMIGALAGVGGSVLPVSAAGHVGAAWIEGLLAALLLVGVVPAATAGTILVFIGVKKAGGDDLASRMIRLGVALQLLGLFVGLLTAVGVMRLPRVGVSTHVTLMISGLILMGFGLVWSRLTLGERAQRAAFGLLATGAFANFGAGLFAGLLGVGGRTLPVAADGAVGPDGAEGLVALVIGISVVANLVGIVLVWRGAPPFARTVRPRVARGLALAGALVVAFALFYHGLAYMLFQGAYPIELPEYGDADVDWLWDDARYTRAQNWTPDDWQWFYHAPQGGAFELPVPYDWMMALEQPRVPLWPGSRLPRLMDPDYLLSFGFLENPRTSYDPDGVSLPRPEWLEPFSRIVGDSINNPDGLPVGFARANGWLDQATGETMDAMGFTCAACHTGQLDYERPDGTLARIRIEGGPAHVDLLKFRTAVTISVALTKLLPGRFDRFAERLGQTSEEDKRLLEAKLDALLDRGRALRAFQDSAGMYPIEEGFGRLDALNRIANYVFVNDVGIPENALVADAPVNFPFLWDAPWFQWVQYNGSLGAPMTRNVGETMGVFASLDLKGAGPGVPVEEDPLLFTSSVDLVTVHEMEQLLTGPFRLGGLSSPTWPSIFPPVDSARADRGEELYREHCAQCHLSMDRDSFFDDDRWTPPEEGRPALKLPLVDLDRIGTDPNQALGLVNHRVELGPLADRLGIPREMGEAQALPLLIQRVTAKAIADRGLEEHAAELNGNRPDRVQAPLAYRARPLNGIWATPPFLHNGSVPNLYLLLSPQADRPSRFWLGSRMFDPDSVGFRGDEMRGGFLFDTSLPGNSNAGHVFDDDPGAKGVIGPRLTGEERWDLIEYLKTIPPLPWRP